MGTRPPAASAAGLRLLARHDLGGHGDGIHLHLAADRTV
jgi:hypothetical protein